MGEDGDNRRKIAEGHKKIREEKKLLVALVTDILHRVFCLLISFVSGLNFSYNLADSLLNNFKLITLSVCW